MWCCYEVPPVLDEANIVDNPKIVVNRTVLLECPVSGIPVPRVKWLKNGKPLVFSGRVRRLSAGRRVQIVRARVSDTARYTCIAVNDAGQLSRNYDLEVLGIYLDSSPFRQSHASTLWHNYTDFRQSAWLCSLIYNNTYIVQFYTVRFLLSVVVPPSIDGKKLETVQILENHTAYLSCPVSGIPRPSVIWYKNGVPLFDAVYANLRQLNAAQQLEVRHVRADDEAVFKCQAGNVAGQTIKRFKLKVLGSSLRFTFIFL